MPDESALRQEICEIGRRIYTRGFAAGNDGNISCRLDDQRLLCTPTMICKGFMRPDDLCVVDLAGKQLAGPRVRTSEVLLHCEVYRGDPSATAVVHCHPPHATAFGIARQPIPSGILPEVEIFLGLVPTAPYDTPGSARFADTIRPFVGRAAAVVLSNHGTVSWGASPEVAFWNTEILDAYCRILVLSKQIGGITRLPDEKVIELLELRERLGYPPDPRRTGQGPLVVNPDFGATS